MAIKIQIPTPMREQTGGKAEVEVTGGTVKAALDDLVRQFPAVAPKLFDSGKLRPYINVVLNPAVAEEAMHYLVTYLQRLGGEELRRVREDMATLAGFAKSEKWNKQQVRFLQEFLKENGIGS